MPHQVRKHERPTDSNTLARALRPMVSRGRFSTKMSLRYWEKEVVSLQAKWPCLLSCLPSFWAVGLYAPLERCWP